VVLVGKFVMTEHRTSRQTFLTQVGTTLAAVVTLGLFTKGTAAPSESSQAKTATPEPCQAVPEARAVPRQTNR
jgi:hypothetical protein